MSYKLYDAEIEYLETQRNCYIVTNSVPSGSDIAISSKFMFIGYVNNTSWLPWYISYVNENTQTFRIARDGSSNTTIRINNGAKANGANGDAQFTVSANGIYEIVTNGRTITVNGVTKTGRVASSSLNTAPMRIMNAAFKGRCYYFKMWNGNTILLDCIPVRVGNVGYLFDKVSMKLFGNSGTGSFVLGPDVSYDVPEANEVAFLESWGNQYIDTGIKPSTDTKIELKCLYCKSGVGLTNYGALIGADDRANAYTLTHSDMANFTFGESVSKDFANPQTRLLTFDSTASPQNMRVYDEEGSLVTTLTCIRGVFEVNQNLYLFAVNRSGTPVYGSNRILYCKIYDGDTLVRDYVPVEYNGIGYMYDKVSGLFFDNKGTGKFLFGSIAKACARSYTRRQLMAKAPVPWRNQYLTFKAVESGTFTLSQNAVSYSLDEGITWNTLTAGTASPNVPAGKTIMWKGTITPSTTTGVGTFSATGSFNVLGNAMSLLFGDNFAMVKTLSGKTDAFYNLFLNNKKLVSAENLSLPALTMASRGYRSMFQGCNNLVYPPELPATTLAISCYYNMFNGCTSLTTAPVLPATTLAYSCYGYMFNGCTSLVTVPSVLPATTLVSNCYYYMFYKCTSLTTAPELPATTLAYYCYYSMFRECASLTVAPELPATTLASNCYRQMFQGCTKLNYIKAMFTTTPSDSSPNYYTSNWVRGVSATGTFVKNSAATWDVTGVNGIPSGWTVETADE